jgi:hypothetical protein
VSLIILVEDGDEEVNRKQEKHAYKGTTKGEQEW